MQTNIEKTFFTVDYEYNVPKWIEETRFYYADSTPNIGDVIIIGISNTCYQFKNPLYNNHGIFEGSVFEKAEPTKYDVTVNLVYKGSKIKSMQTTNGDFKFIGINKELEYTMEFIDNTNKYNPKMLKDIIPGVDDSQPPEVQLFFKLVTGDKIDYYFGIHYQGVPTVSLIGAPPSFNLMKISDSIYRVVGSVPINTKPSFTIQLDDLRDIGKVTSTKEVKNSNI